MSTNSAGARGGGRGGGGRGGGGGGRGSGGRGRGSGGRGRGSGGRGRGSGGRGGRGGRGNDGGGPGGGPGRGPGRGRGNNGGGGRGSDNGGRGRGRGRSRSRNRGRGGRGNNAAEPTPTPTPTPDQTQPPPAPPQAGKQPRRRRRGGRGRGRGRGSGPEPEPNAGATAAQQKSKPTPKPKHPKQRQNEDLAAVLSPPDRASLSVILAVADAVRPLVSSRQPRRNDVPDLLDAMWGRLEALAPSIDQTSVEQPARVLQAAAELAGVLSVAAAGGGRGRGRGRRGGPAPYSRIFGIALKHPVFTGRRATESDTFEPSANAHTIRQPGSDYDDDYDDYDDDDDFGARRPYDDYDDFDDDDDFSDPFDYNHDDESDGEEPLDTLSAADFDAQQWNLVWLCEVAAAAASRPGKPIVHALLGTFARDVVNWTSPKAAAGAVLRGDGDDLCPGSCTHVQSVRPPLAPVETAACLKHQREHTPFGKSTDLWTPRAPAYLGRELVTHDRMHGAVLEGPGVFFVTGTAALADRTALPPDFVLEREARILVARGEPDASAAWRPAQEAAATLARDSYTAFLLLERRVGTTRAALRALTPKMREREPEFSSDDEFEEVGLDSEGDYGDGELQVARLSPDKLGTLCVALLRRTRFHAAVEARVSDLLPRREHLERGVASVQNALTPMGASHRDVALEGHHVHDGDCCFSGKSARSAPVLQLLDALLSIAEPCPAPGGDGAPSPFGADDATGVVLGLLDGYSALCLARTCRGLHRVAGGELRRGARRMAERVAQHVERELLPGLLDASVAAAEKQRLLQCFERLGRAPAVAGLSVGTLCMLGEALALASSSAPWAEGLLERCRAAAATAPGATAALPPDLHPTLRDFMADAAQRHTVFRGGWGRALATLCDSDLPVVARLFSALSTDELVELLRTEGMVSLEFADISKTTRVLEVMGLLPVDF